MPRKPDPTHVAIARRRSDGSVETRSGVTRSRRGRSWVKWRHGIRRIYTARSGWREAADAAPIAEPKEAP